jgi:hypothetical protein
VARNLTTRPKSLFGPCGTHFPYYSYCAACRVSLGALLSNGGARADIEGHRGTDGRFYIVDTARLYPAEVRARV